MFHLALHLIDSRPAPDDPADGEFVYAPGDYDASCFTATAARDLLDGGHATFTITAFGGSFGVVPHPDIETALMDYVWDAKHLVALLSGPGDGGHQLAIVEQGFEIYLDFVKRGDLVTVTGRSPTGDLIADRTLRPSETLPALQLLAEVRQVSQAVIDGGTCLGSSWLHHFTVFEWCQQIGIRPPGVG